MPPSTSPKSLDEQLREFLAREDREHRDGNTIRGIKEFFEKRFERVERDIKDVKQDVEDIKTSQERVESRQEETEERVKRHGKRITNLEFSDELDTGTHSIVDVDKKLQARDLQSKKDELDELKEKQRWLVRAIIGAIIAVLGSLGAGYILGNWKK